MIGDDSGQPFEGHRESGHGRLHVEGERARMDRLKAEGMNWRLEAAARQAAAFAGGGTAGNAMGVALEDTVCRRRATDGIGQALAAG